MCVAAWHLGTWRCIIGVARRQITPAWPQWRRYRPSPPGASCFSRAAVIAKHPAIARQSSKRIIVSMPAETSRSSSARQSSNIAWPIALSASLRGISSQSSASPRITGASKMLGPLSASSRTRRFRVVAPARALGLRLSRRVRLAQIHDVVALIISSLSWRLSASYE